MRRATLTLPHGPWCRLPLRANWTSILRSIFDVLHGWLGLSGHAAAPSGQDAFAVRFLSLWFGVLFVALMYALGRRAAIHGAHGRFWAGLGAAVGAAFLPFLLGEAQEARMYTMALVWLAAAGLALLRAVAGGQEPAGRHQKNAGYWLLFASLSALALLTHYATAFAAGSVVGLGRVVGAVGRAVRTLAAAARRAAGRRGHGVPLSCPACRWRCVKSHPIVIRIWSSLLSALIWPSSRAFTVWASTSTVRPRGPGFGLWPAFWSRVGCC